MCVEEPRLLDTCVELVVLASVLTAVTVTTDVMSVVTFANVTCRASVICFLLSSVFWLCRNPLSAPLASLRFSRAALCCFLRASRLARADEAEVLALFETPLVIDDGADEELTSTGVGSLDG